jgi:hypothetical protein
MKIFEEVVNHNACPITALSTEKFLIIILIISCDSYLFLCMYAYLQCII